MGFSVYYILIMLMIRVINIGYDNERREKMQPDTSIGYWLSYAHRSFSSAFSEILRRHCTEQGKAYVITPSQWGILSFLAQEQEQTISALAKLLGVDAPAVTNIVQRLEQSGLETDARSGRSTSREGLAPCERENRWCKGL